LDGRKENFWMNARFDPIAVEGILNAPSFFAPQASSRMIRILTLGQQLQIIRAVS
jgi:hypothetical protein